MALMLIAIGSNLSGTLGSRESTMKQVPDLLHGFGIDAIAASRIFETQPIGRIRQPQYLNAVLLCRSNQAPASVLRLLKRLEGVAGRRVSHGRGARNLDLDLIWTRGMSNGWPPRRRHRGRLILPHPEAHSRAFVLYPLLDVMPFWFHPMLGATGRQLANRLRAQRGMVRPTLDSLGVSCTGEPVYMEIPERVVPRGETSHDGAARFRIRSEA